MVTTSEIPPDPGGEVTAPDRYVENDFQNKCYNLIRRAYHKITEPTNISQYQRKNLRYEFIDLYKTVEEDPLTLSIETKKELEKKKLCTRFFSYFMLEQTWLLLMLLGIFSGMMAILLEFALSSLIGLRTLFEDYVEEQCGEHSYCKFVRFLSYVVYCVFFSGLAGCIVRFISPQAAGSGLPEMKSILSGVVLPRYLSYRVFIGKYLGLICGLVGGLSIGKEAPFVHISGIIANQLSKIRVFNRIRKNEALRFQMLSAGSAAGVSCIFGAPIGGVLFSIEVTTTYFLVQNLWKLFFCSIAAAMTVKLGGDSGIFAIFPTYFSQNSYRSWEILVFITMGVSFGYLGAMFVRTVLKMVHLRRDYKMLGETRYYQLIILAVVSACLLYPFSAVHAGSDDVVKGLFGIGPDSMSEWGSNVILKLFAFVVVKFVLTCVSLGLPVPCGLYTPVFMMGAVSGRLVGEIMAMFFEDGYITPGGYAVVGAAAMSAGATRTLSTAVIVLELTGQLEFLLPVLLATIISTAVGNQFSAGAYDTLLEQKRLPYMAPFGHLRMPSDMTNAKDLMRTDVVFLRYNADFNDVNEILDNHYMQSYPVVNPDSMLLRGSVTRRALVKILEAHDTKFCECIEKQLNQVSTAGESIQRLKNRYTGFSVESSDDQVVDDESESEFDVDEGYSQMRRQFFSVPISDELNKMTRSDFDTSPFQVPEGAHFYQIHFMFAMLGLNHAFIIRNGNMVGVITKKDFLEKTRSQIMWQ